MSEAEPPKRSNPSRGVRRIPKNSLLYDRLVPLALIAIAVLTGLIILVALLILLGVI